MNGSIGRARQLAKIKRERRRWAEADGVDVNDPEAYAKWEKERFDALIQRIKESAGIPVDEHEDLS